jgi:hypothetical protein
MLRIPLFTAAIALALPVLTAYPAAAADAQACTTDETFCATYSLTVTDPGTQTAQSHAAAPADVTASLSNTSPAHATDMNVWWSSVSVALANGLGGDVFTPSAALDPDLLVAGSSSDCGPDAANGYSFSSCSAGYGTLYANVTGTSLYDGIHPGTFGIERIVNHAQSGGNLIDWIATVEVCVSTPFGCNSGSPQSESIEVVASPQSKGTVTIPTTSSFNFATAYVTASIDSVSALNLLGRSGTLADGSQAPRGMQTVVHLPTQCGTANGGLTATDSETTPQSVTVPLSLDVTGCPTAAVTATEPAPYTADLDASGSAAGVSGRTLTYHWTFPDGQKTTTTPTVTHRFATSRPADVGLEVIDSLGAMSPPLTVQLKGSRLTLTAPHSARSGHRVKLAGRLTGWRNKPALKHRDLDVQRCRKNGKHCTAVAAPHTSAKGRWKAKAKFSKRQPMFVVSFGGGGGYLGTTAQRKVHARKH